MELAGPHIAHGRGQISAKRDERDVTLDEIVAAGPTRRKG